MNDDKIPAGKYAVSTSNRTFEGRQGPGARTLLASPLVQLAQCQWKVASRCAAKGFSVTADYFQRAYRASSSSVAKYRVEANIS